MDKKFKHMDMIQSIVTRMAGNSFALKGWAVTLLAGLFVLSEKDSSQFYYLIAYLPIVVFWCLDTYYLRQERLYRKLYNKVREMDEKDIDFDLAATQEKVGDKTTTYPACFFSPTILGFYLPLAAVAGVVFWLASQA